jgi:hypothetical protein
MDLWPPFWGFLDHTHTDTRYIDPIALAFEDRLISVQWESVRLFSRVGYYLYFIQLRELFCRRTLAVQRRTKEQNITSI